MNPLHLSGDSSPQILSPQPCLPKTPLKMLAWLVLLLPVAQAAVPADCDAISKPVGYHTARIIEAGDAAGQPGLVVDGEDGDVDFPFGNLKPIATVGEADCDADFVVVGVPDGMGSYLADDTTLRMVVQSESYGTITAEESRPFYVNNGAASFTGSHVQYVDYDREMMSNFMDSDFPAMDMVKGYGNMIEHAYNLKGEPVGPRNLNGPTTVGAHYSNCDAEGNYVIVAEPTKADWIMQSLCAAHLEEVHQWGPGIGVEDELFVTNEEWIVLDSSKTANFVGLSAHVIDLATKTSYAVGVFTLSGFEKITEFSTGTTDFVAFVVSGYNGDFGNYEGVLAAKNAMGPRSDGTDWVWTRYVAPSRFYIGKKGYDVNGDPATDFLSRNGLAYGQMYGFATDVAATGYADPWHQVHYNGDMVNGGFYPIDWRWDGVVRNFEYDGAWQFQEAPLNAPAEYEFWTATNNTLTTSGKKMEHCSPDPYGNTAYFQSSTAGYFGKYDMPNMAAEFAAAAGDFPPYFEATYYLYQGETEVTDFIDLGGKGANSDGGDQKVMFDGRSTHTTFEDIDGMMAYSAADGETYFLIQEDGGNDYGERMFTYRGSFDYGTDYKLRPYKFVAMSGGDLNTRALAQVGVPAGTWTYAGSNEFSSPCDISGLLAKDDQGNFLTSASDTGYARRLADASVPINEKKLITALQAHHLRSGVIAALEADRGGQWLMYQPNLPTFLEDKHSYFTDKKAELVEEINSKIAAAEANLNKPGQTQAFYDAAMANKATAESRLDKVVASFDQKIAGVEALM